MGLIFDCKQTYYVDAPKCVDQMTVDLGVPAGEYTIILQTPYGRQYRGMITVADGSFTIDSTNYPAELFNPWIGVFIVQLFEGNTCEPTTFTICEVVYNTLAIRFVEMVDAPEPFTLICECAAV